MFLLGVPSLSGAGVPILVESFEGAAPFLAGDVAIVDSTVAGAVPEGSRVAFLTTVGPFNANPVGSSGKFTAGALEVVNLENQLLLPAGLVNLSGLPGREGSALQISGNFAAGDVLSFDFNLLTDADLPPADADFAFYALNDVIGGSIAFQAFASVQDASFVETEAPLAALFLYESGWGSLDVTIPSDSFYELSIGIADTASVPGTSAGSGLLIDQVTLIPVPEPGQFALLAAMVAVCLGFLRRNRGGSAVT